MKIMDEISPHPDPRIHRETLALEQSGESHPIDACKPVVTIEDPEVRAMAKQYHRAWQLEFYFGIGKCCTIPGFRILRDLDTLLHPSAMKQIHLHQALLCVWAKRANIEGKLPPLPPEIRDLLERKVEKIAPPEVGKRCRGIFKRPPVDCNNGLYPKVKNLVRHLREKFSWFHCGRK